MLLFVVFIFTYNEIKTVKPKINIYEAIYRMAVLFFRGLPISLCFGIILMSLTFPRVMNDANVYPPTALLVKSIDSLKMIDNLPSELTSLMLNPIGKANFEEENRILDTTIIFQSKYLKDYYSEIENHLVTMAKCKVAKDSTDVHKKRFDSCKIKCELIGAKFLNDYFKNKLYYKYPIIDEIAKQACGNSIFPCIVKTDLLMIRYIFPPLLILGSTMSFLIGFFIQFVRTARFIKLSI